MRHTEFNWRGGRVDFWDLDQIDRLLSVQEQASLLKEDLAQIAYQNGAIIDLGWFPSFSPAGEFVLSVIRESDWVNPSGQWKPKTWLELVVTLNEAIAIASRY